MRFLWYMLKVSDMERSLMFYQDAVGLELEQTFWPTPDKQVAFLVSENGVRIELVQDNEEILEGHEAGISLGFGVDNLDEKIAELCAKRVWISQPAKSSLSQRFIFAKDPDGYMLQFVEQK